MCVSVNNPPPCLPDCSGRSEGCHGKCEKYKAWKAKLKREREPKSEIANYYHYRKIRTQKKITEKRKRGRK